MQSPTNAEPAGAGTPESETARGANAGRIEQDTGEQGNRDFAGSRHAKQALKSIEGESKAARFLTRLAAQQADSAEFAVIVAALYGDELRGFSKVIVKALKARLQA